MGGLDPRVYIGLAMVGVSVILAVLLTYVAPDDEDARFFLAIFAAVLGIVGVLFVIGGFGGLDVAED